MDNPVIATGTNTINPVDGSLLPTQTDFPLTFTYAPTTPGPLQIDVKWESDDNNLKFSKNPTTTDPQTGKSNNSLYYFGDTPATPPTITLTNDKGDTLLQFKYDFKNVQFLYGAVGLPSGLQNVWPFQEFPAPDPKVTGIAITATAIDPDTNDSPVPNFTMLFGSINNALRYYDPGTGKALDPLTQGDGESARLLYPVTANANGVAEVLAMPSSAGIFGVNVGYGSGGSAITAQLVWLYEVAPPNAQLLDPLDFQTEDTATATIPLDSSTGATFPVRAPGTILTTNGGGVRPTDSAILVTFTAPDKQANGLMVGEIMQAEDLVQGVGMPKSRAVVGKQTGYFYMVSNGVTASQSSVVTLGATGTAVIGPDPNVTRDRSAPTSTATVLNASTILGGVPMSFSLFTLQGLADGDKYTVNVYLDGFNGNTAQVKTDFHSRDFIRKGMTAQNQLLPQDWFLGYGENGGRMGTAKIEVIGHLSPTTVFYSKVLSLTLDTVGG